VNIRSVSSIHNVITTYTTLEPSEDSLDVVCDRFHGRIFRIMVGAQQSEIYIMPGRPLASVPNSKGHV
jgi:hypothetical protein